MTIRGINFKSAAFAGFASAYVMFFIDKWYAGFLGLFGAFPKPPTPLWLIEHHVDGILIGLVFAWPAVYRRLPGPGPVKGLAFGFLWTVGFGVAAVVTGPLGAKVMAGIPFTLPVVATNLILHLIYGFFLGVLYTPPAAAPPGAQREEFLQV